MDNANSYIPYLLSIEKIVREAPGVKTFRLKFENGGDAESFSFKAGQFGEFSMMGVGESPFCIASSPTRKGYIECTFRQEGKVTTALTSAEEGDLIGFRGPYGNNFPIGDWKGKNLLFIAGGIALAPMRCLIWNALDLREDFGDITIVYGARTADDLIYKNDLREWASRHDIRQIMTVDPGGETPGWRGEVGLVPHILEKAVPSAENAVAIVCGPPVMIKFVFPVLEKLGFAGKNIFTTLENRMKCGFGKCGRCNVGDVYVCKDGPVFSYEQLKLLPAEY